MDPTLRPNALTTLDRLKEMLGISLEDTGNDGVLIQLINQASASIEKALGRKLKKQVYCQKCKGTGNQYLLMEQYPIREIKSIRQGDILMDPALYDVPGGGMAGVIYKDDGWTYHGYPYGLTGDYVAGKRDIQVEYVAGYTLPGDATVENPCDLPADLEGLCQEMTGYAYGKLQSGGSEGLKSFSISDVRWEWQTDTPTSWQETIDRYRRAWI